MKPNKFRYSRPTSLDEALGLLRDHGDDAKVLAGGQSLVPLMNARLAQPELIVDINQVDELRRLDVNGDIRIGAGVSQLALEESAAAAGVAPILREALEHVAHVGIRTRGTVCGSVAHADPAAELPATVLALGGSMRVAGPDGSRVVAADDFFQTFFTTAVGEDELLVEIEIPRSGPDSRSAFVEVSRRRGDFALVAAAAVLDYAGGAAANARIALAGVADVPVLAVEAQQFIEGRDPGDAEVRAEAGRLAAAVLEPGSDIHAPAEYRRRVAAVLIERALGQAVNDN